jgi:AcrR family transcriptional regulator
MAASTSRPSRRARNPRGQGQRLRTALIDAAIALLAELEDVEALSIRAVTARAGVTPTALYLHFADKEELETAVKDRCFRELRRYVLTAEAQSGPDPRAQLKAMGHAYLDFAAERPGYYRALFHTRRASRPAGSEAGGAPASAPGLAETERETDAAPDAGAAIEIGGPPAGADAFGDLVRGVARCLPPGRDAFPTAFMVWAGLHGYTGLRTMIHFPLPPADAYLRQLLDDHLGAA